MRQGAFYDGWRGRIGLVSTAPGNSTEADFNRYRPEGVAVLTTRTPLAASTVESIRQMNGHMADAAAMLGKNCYADVIFLSSTAGSFVNGPKGDKAEAERLASLAGAPVLTSCGCLLRALQAVEAERISLVTPTSHKLHEAEKAYLEACAISVAGEANLDLSDPRDILAVDPKEVYRLAKDADTAAAQAVVISCSGLHLLEMIDILEQDLGKPVLTSNQFGLWGTLRALGVQEKICGLGTLFDY